MKDLYSRNAKNRGTTKAQLEFIRARVYNITKSVQQDSINAGA